MEEEKWPMDKVRSTFINFFVEKYNHTYWKSSPCVPHDDPTLLFTNAGMNQFKSVFLGTCDPNVPLYNMKRACNSQKCIRAGGKHNDLDDVGKDVYHHTFFEMLGNWSFGDYFKEEAIEMAWKCLTEEFGLDKSRLYVTYFEGNESAPEDVEARQIWLRFLPSERILPFAAKDNFWEMGVTGPCGPCTEIHYDRIGNRDASKLVNADLPDVIEIWNNVFIQFNREVDGSLRRLPLQHVDTGMGFERLTSILQNKNSNYDTDVFTPIFDEITLITSARPYKGLVGVDDVNYVDTAYRVVADHVRTLCFAIADGAVPSNDGRGYVLRRILRRAVRYGRQNLNAELGFFAKLVPVVVKLMGKTFEELIQQENHILEIISSEEESFSRTLDKGLIKFQEMAQNSGTVFSGADAHFLYTTMGFPVDLTELMLEERSMTLDKKGFEVKMKEEHDLSTAAHKAKVMGGSISIDMSMEAEQTSFLINKVAVTEDLYKYTDQLLENCLVQALYLGRGQTDDGIGFTPKASKGTTVGIVINKTSFYAEQGGQIYDTGIFLCGNQTLMKVENVQVYAGFIVHIGILLEDLAVCDKINCSVDYTRRVIISSNHTMTHVLNYALRDILVTKTDSNFKIDQKGSLVDDMKLRFDFSWNGPISQEDLQKIENICVAIIHKNLPVESHIAPLIDAKQICSLRAVFGELYPDPVRVVSIASHSLQEILQNPSSDTWMDYSIEFCGGTHLQSTLQAQDFVLLNEEGIAKGIRRITAVTLQAARDATQKANDLEQKFSSLSQVSPENLEEEIKHLSTQLDSLSISAVRKTHFRSLIQTFSKQVFAYKKKQAAQVSQNIVQFLFKEAKNSTKNKIVSRYDFPFEGKLAKKIVTSFQKQAPDKSLFWLVVSGEKIYIVAFSSKQPKVDCKDWVLSALSCVDSKNYKGGGKPQHVQYTVECQFDQIDHILNLARSF